MHPCEITYKGLTFHNAEAAYQAQKCANEEDKLQFTELTDPVEAKRLGYKVKKIKNWDAIKDSIMYEICLIKFTQNQRFAKVLLSTGLDDIIEENFHNDIYWGTCNGVGDNRLGKILECIRGRIRQMIICGLHNLSADIRGVPKVDSIFDDNILK
jgi:ribA/ribD-fused uncharacterized protein